MAKRYYLFGHEAAPAFTPILDTYPGANLAYSSARKLKNTATYAYKLSNSSGTLDVGFIGEDVDDVLAQTFSNLDGGITYVDIIYDQSGNARDAVFLAGKKPYFKNGVFYDVSGKPAISAELGTMYYDYPSSFVTNALFCAIKPVAQSAQNYILSGALLSYGYSIGGTSAGRFPFVAKGAQNLFSIDTVASNSPYIETFVNYGPTNSIYINNSQTTNSDVIKDITITSLFRPPSSIGRGFRSCMAEIITYETDQFSNEAGIRANINNYYTIY